VEACQPVCPASRIRIHWTFSQKVRGLNEKRCLQFYISPTDGNTDALKVVTCSVASVLSTQLGQVALLRGCVAIVHEMEACTQHSSLRLKQRAVIEFLSGVGVFQIKIHSRMQGV